MVIIALSVFNKLQIQELWIEFGTGIHNRWLSIHEYAANLGIQVCAAILFWYASTGCDTVSAFGGRGKKMAWDT